MLLILELSTSSRILQLKLKTVKLDLLGRAPAKEFFESLAFRTTNVSLLVVGR